MICHHDILLKLETKFNCVLHAEEETDIVNGAVSIIHKQGEHKIRVDFYDNEKPNRMHQTNFKKLKKIPTESEIKKII